MEEEASLEVKPEASPTPAMLALMTFVLQDGASIKFEVSEIHNFRDGVTY